jgi:hypothetical protein
MFNHNKEIKASSINQSGGITANKIQNNKNLYFNIWKERGKGAILLVVLEFLIYLLKYLLKF